MSQSASQNVPTSAYLDQPIQDAISDFNQLQTDDKLALLYYIYEKMGDSVTPAAPQAAEPELTPILMGDYFNLSHQDQLQIMRDIVNGSDTEYARAYGAIKENNQLLVWYAWAEAMGESVIDMPSDYSVSDTINNLLGKIEELDFEQQISMLREIASTMGYSEIKSIPTQSETGKTASL